MYTEGRQVAYGGPPLALSMPSSDPKLESDRLSHGTLPLIDTKTRRFIGLSSVQFPLDGIIADLDDTSIGTQSFKMLTKIGPGASPKDNIFLTDLLGDPLSESPTGPGYSLEEVLLPYDQCDNATEAQTSCNNLKMFREIETLMRQGGVAFTKFTRTGPNGLQQTVNYGYFPVFLPSHRPTDPSNFTRGTTFFFTPVWAVSLAQIEDGIKEDFESIGVELDSVAERFLTMLISLLAVVIVVVAVVSWFLAMSVSIPVAQLLTIIKAINR